MKRIFISVRLQCLSILVDMFCPSQTQTGIHKHIYTYGHPHAPTHTHQHTPPPPHTHTQHQADFHLEWYIYLFITTLEEQVGKVEIDNHL